MTVFGGLMFYSLYILLVISCWENTVVSRPTEQERVQQWYEQHTWPPKWQEEGPNYRKLMEDREKE